jgi:DNA-directed RNA polymerase subunit RPC12/RpoP
MPTINCPKCGTEVNLQPGVVTACGGCGTKLRPKAEVPAVLPADDAGEPRASRPRRRPRFDDDEDRGGPQCPECGSHRLQKGPWPWYLGTVGLFFCKAMVCKGCGHEFDLYKPHADLARRKLNLAIAINGVGLVGIIIVLTLLFLWIRATLK